MAGMCLSSFSELCRFRECLLNLCVVIADKQLLTQNIFPINLEGISGLAKVFA